MTDQADRGQHKPVAQRDSVASRPVTARASGLLRGWLRRIKHSTWARRIVFPLLQRFPQLQGPLRRLSEGAQPKRTVPVADLAPDWSGPLPADYANMSEPARKALLDLARAGESAPDR